MHTMLSSVDSNLNQHAHVYFRLFTAIKPIQGESRQKEVPPTFEKSRRIWLQYLCVAQKRIMFLVCCEINEIV